MLIDQLGNDVLSSEDGHVFDGARVVDVPDAERLDVSTIDRRGVDDESAGHCEELEVAAKCLSQLGEV